MKTVSLRQAWIALITAALLLGLVPAGVALDRRLGAELEREARADLAMTPMILSDRNAGRSDALMMRAKELAGSDGLGTALAAGRREEALRIARAAAPSADEEPVVVGPEGEAWTEPAPPESVVAETRDGAMPVVFGHDGEGLYRLGLAPVLEGGRWVGAAGVLTRLGPQVADELSALTRSDVALLGPGGSVSYSTLDGPLPTTLRDSAAAWSGRKVTHETVTPDGRRYWAAVAPLGDAGHAVFVRDVEEELALLPGLRRSALLAVGIALVLALLLGGVLAARMSRPVRALSVASQRLAAGEFDAPVPSSRIREIDRVSRAFREMRSRLAEKIRELTAANRELEDRQARLQALQSELIQKDRAAATGRIVTELAHEIRNPVASVRNCLELIHRRLEEGSELREFSSMAIDELLRMHRLSEQMLDANRPLDPGAERCSPFAVARRVAELAGMAREGDGPAVEVRGEEELEVAMPPDALKQVLLNLVDNAREALSAERGAEGADAIEIVVAREEEEREGGRYARVEVLDAGPGLDEEVAPRVFDPFFTTKDEVHGVGLGLFVAQGLVRRHGGSIRAENREEGGARFVLRLPIGASAGEGAAGDEAAASDEEPPS